MKENQHYGKSRPDDRMSSMTMKYMYDFSTYSGSCLTYTLLEDRILLLIGNWWVPERNNNQWWLLSIHSPLFPFSQGLLANQKLFFRLVFKFQIYKSFLYFHSCFILFIYLLAALHSVWDLSSWTRDQIWVFFIGSTHSFFILSIYLF